MERVKVPFKPKTVDMVQFFRCADGLRGIDDQIPVLVFLAKGLGR